MSVLTIPSRPSSAQPLQAALLQFNPIVGDMAGNARKIVEAARRAHADGAQLVVTPELTVGYNYNRLPVNIGARAFYAVTPRTGYRISDQDVQFNEHAAGLYASMGFTTAHEFLIHTREAAGTGPRNRKASGIG